MPSPEPVSRILPPEPVEDLAAYRASGGGEGIAQARRIGPTETIARIADSGLRGRGGAGFPTGVKWRGIAGSDPDQPRYVVCNAAEGEPGTFKDRAILRANPYQVMEGIGIAAHAVGAAQAYIGIKESYTTELDRLERAAGEMEEAGLFEEISVHVVAGPDDYLFGEEKALLEVIEGRDALPRWYPPYILGLHTGMTAGVGAGSIGADEAINPTLVNNVETLANVPHILSEGVEWFRQHGTEESPGTMVLTVCGDVRTEGVAELPLGVPLSLLIYGVGGGLEAGRRLKMVLSGASNPVLTDDRVDTPLGFETLTEAGSGLGSGGFIVYDDTACAADIGAVYSRFLAIESCGQCPPCKLGCTSLADHFDALQAGTQDPYDLQEMAAWVDRVTDANRCGLGAGERALAAGLLNRFSDELGDHVGRGCWFERRVRLAKLAELDPEEGRFTYDEGYFERPPR